MNQVALKFLSLSLLRKTSVRLLAAAGLATMGLAGAAELQILDGVVVKFGADAELVARDKLSVGKGAVFTSSKDDKTGGALGASAQTPAPGDWRGIRIEKSAPTSHLAEGIAVRHAGGANGAGLTLRGVKPTIHYAQFTDNLVGLRTLDGASPPLTGLSFLRNGTGLEADGNSAPLIAGSQFAQNTSNAILNRTPATLIQATGNWWGNATGPKDPAGNPQGQGDAVSSGVNYGGYLAQAPLINPTIRLASPAAYLEQSVVAVTIACINATEYRIAENAAFAGLAFQPLTDGQATVNVALSAGDGNKPLSVQFRGSDGNVVTAQLSGGILVDTQAPQLTITNPLAGKTISQPITISATAIDAGGIDRVEFYLNNEFKGKASASPYSYHWNTEQAADGQHVWRVVAFDRAGRSTEQTRSVTFSQEVVPPDTAGPVAADPQFDGAALADGATLTRNGTVTAVFSDASGIAKVELLLDGTAVASMTGSSGNYSGKLNLDNVANGSHVLTIRAIDSLNNVSQTTFQVTVSHEPPPAPQLGQQLNGTTTRYKDQTVSGQAQPGSQVQLYLNNVPFGTALTAGSDGRFAAPVTLAVGANQIQASAADQYGTSALSDAISITLDASVPAAPSSLSALAQAGGKIKLSWTRSSDPNAASVAIYRSSSPFAATGEAAKLNTVAASVTTYEDMPAQDGTYYYRLVSQNAAGTPSDPSGQAGAVADSKPPRASVAYTPLGKVDAVTGRIGQGKVNVVVTVTEPLQAAPYFALVPNGTAPISVELVKQDDTRYSGSFTIDAAAGSGMANALFSGRDLVGNRGTDVDAGATLNIDTEGPTLTGIAVAPASPIKNDTAQTVTATFTLSKPMKSGEAPQLRYLLSGPVRSATTISGLSQLNATTWSGSFTLPADAGAGSPETFSFSYRGIDDLDNVSTRVAAGTNRFQVYQGQLPPPDVPLGFKAEARPGGKVRLSWLAVDQAAAYQLYRQGPNDTGLQALQRTAGIDYIDTVPQNGKYLYAVATVRQSNGQESLSGQSAAVEVTASATAPGAPQNLTLNVVGAGLQATWQPPANSSVASYNLYRAGGLSLTSVEGLTPIKTGIKQPGAIDANPSATDHAYAVTALDAAGNESAPSNSAYLNASLLPVSTLKVEQIGSQLPQLHWSASKTANAGYYVYIGPDAARIKLTPSPTSALSFEDSGYTSGERRYTVATVDSNGIEQPRTITLPHVSVSIASGMPIKRGIMNKLQVQVANTSSEGFDNAKVVVRINNIDHQSDTFALAANEIRIVPVVVGGYADLQANAPMQLGLEIAPNEGELVKLARDVTADIADGSLVVGIATEEFTRGGTGKVRLTIENTTEAEVEFLTARDGGKAESDELRFKLLDADGNVLATQAYKQVFGANVITLGSGLTVARVAAGASYTSDAFEVNVPQSAPGNIRVRLEVDKIRYHTGQPDEIVIKGKGSEKPVLLVDTAYTGEVTNVTPVSSFGDQDIVISGRALSRSNNAPLPHTRLKLLMNQQGFERSFTTLTDAAGTFHYTFKPTLTDSGLYKVAAVHPSITDRPEQRSFTINRVTVGPTPVTLNVPYNYSYSIPFTAKAGAGTQASNLRLVLDPAAQPAGQIPPGISVQPWAPVSITSGQTLNIPAVFSAGPDAQPSGTLVLSAYSDESPAAPIGQVTVKYTLSEAKPILQATPGIVETGLAKGTSALESLVVENKGLLDAANLQFTLVHADGSPAPAWAAIVSKADGNLAVGEKRAIDLSFTPPADTLDGVYEFKLKVHGDNVPEQSLHVFASVTQSGEGNVFFKASDLYTGTVGKNGQLIPGLAGSTIILQNEDVATLSYELVTDALGEALFQNIPAGRYTFRAKAANHQELGGRIQVKPGITLTQPVFLNYNLITVEWSVREIAIQDRYEITLNATFETDVPAAVVVMQPSGINLPKMNPGDVFYGELSLTNYGLVRAENVRQKLPVTDSYFRFEFLAEVPPTLEAKQRITIPYRVVSLQSLENNGAASGGGCYSYNNATKVDFQSRCPNGDNNSGSTSANWFSAGGSCSSTGTGPWTGEGGGGSSSFGDPVGTSLGGGGGRCVFIPTGAGGGC